MKKIAIAFALALGVFAATGVAGADEEGAPMAKGEGKGKHKARWKKFQKFLKGIGVSEETLAKAKDMWKEWWKTAKPMREELRNKRKELREVLKAATIDTAKVDALAAEIAEKRSALIKARISHHAKFLSLLTPE